MTMLFTSLVSEHSKSTDTPADTANYFTKINWMFFYDVNDNPVNITAHRINNNSLNFY